MSSHARLICTTTVQQEWLVPSSSGSSWEMVVTDVSLLLLRLLERGILSSHFFNPRMRHGSIGINCQPMDQSAAVSTKRWIWVEIVGICMTRVRLVTNSLVTIYYQLERLTVILNKFFRELIILHRAFAGHKSICLWLNVD